MLLFQLYFTTLLPLLYNLEILLQQRNSCCALNLEIPNLLLQTLYCSIPSMTAAPFLLSCRFYWLASPKFLNYFRTRNFHVALLNKFNIKILLSINALTDHAEQKQFNFFNLSPQLFPSLKNMKIFEIHANTL